MATETAPSAASKQPAKEEAKQPAKEEAKLEAKQPAKEEVKQEAKQPAKEEVQQEAKSNDPYSRVGRAEAIIQRNVIWALGAGVLPFPLVDIATVTAVELKMLKELSTLYEVKFTSDIAHKIIGSLLTGLGSVGVGSVVGASLAKLIPSVGTALGAVAIPVFAGAFTHATGRVFLMHFESGGTFLDFDPHAMRSYFRQEFEKAKEAVAQMHQDEQGKATAAKTP